MNRRRLQPVPQLRQPEPAPTPTPLPDGWQTDWHTRFAAQLAETQAYYDTHGTLPPMPPANS